MARDALLRPADGDPGPVPRVMLPAARTARALAKIRWLMTCHWPEMSAGAIGTYALGCLTVPEQRATLDALVAAGHLAVRESPDARSRGGVCRRYRLAGVCPGSGSGIESGGRDMPVTLPQPAQVSCPTVKAGTT